MRITTYGHVLMLAATTLMHTTTVWAQSRYTCLQANGSYAVSDRPCTTSTSGLTYYPPLNSTVSGTNPIPRAGDAPEYLPYMSARCSAMNDAIRTSAARGLNYQAAGELRRNYQRECADDESEARNRWSQERGEARKAQLEAKQSSTQAHQQAKMAQQQCDESKRIIASKKRRTDLNEGEQGELQRFEANIRARCS